MGDLKPTAVDNNNNSVECANTVLEAHPWCPCPGKKGRMVYQRADNYDVWNSDSYSHKEGMEMKMKRGGGGGGGLPHLYR